MMAHFHGIIRGGRGAANRLGTRSSGFEAVAHSWEGGVNVRLYERNGEDRIRIYGGPHGHETQHLIYDGPVKAIATGKVKLP